VVNHVIDITSTIDRKLKAIKSHVSQTAHAPELDERIREWGARNAEAHGLPKGSLAETFRVVTTG